MMFDVTRSELQQAAGTISKENENFRDAVQRLAQATEVLSQGWTGSANDHFREAMAERLNWYQQMLEIVATYVTSMNQAAQEYGDVDAEAAQLIKKF